MPTPTIPLIVTFALYGLLAVAGGFGALGSKSAQAESVRMVKDINIYGSWNILSSVSNGAVSYQLLKPRWNGPAELLRTTAATTESIDLSAIQVDRDGFVVRIILTQTYLYLRTNDDSIHQMRLDDLSMRKVSTPTENYNYDFTAPVLDEESGVFFYLAKILRSNEDNIFVLRLDEAAATLTWIGEPIPDSKAFRKGGIVNERILVEGRNGLWAIGKNGEDPRKLLPQSDDTSMSELVFSRDYAYFTSDANERFKCELWKTDGTIAGTVVLTGPLSYGLYGCALDMVVVEANRAIFTDVDSRKRRAHIWETRGSAATTQLLTKTRTLRRQRRLPLTHVDDSVWFVRLHASGRPVVWVADLSFQSIRRVLARKEHTLIDLFPINDQMFIQTSDNVKSVLYRANADGSDRTSVFNTIGRLTRKLLAPVDGQVIMPIRPFGPPRELLIGIDLTTGQRIVKRWEEDTNDSTGVDDQVVDGADGNVFFCAMDALESLRIYTTGGIYSGVSRGNIWSSDGTAANTKKIISDVDGGSRINVCGRFAVGPNKIFYARTGNVARVGATQNELWSANKDGSEQRLFVNIDFYPSSLDSSYPEDINALPDGGALYTAVLGRTANHGELRRLVRTYADGQWVGLADAKAVSTEIVGQTDGRFWIKTAREPNEPGASWTLWVTDGTEAGTRRIADGLNTASFVEIDGDVYFVGEMLDQNRRQGLFKIAAGSFRPTFVTPFSAQEDLESCCSGAYNITDIVTDLTVFSGNIVFRQNAHQGQASDQVRRYNVANGIETLLLTSPTSTGRIKSLAVQDDRIYMFREKFINTTTVPDWQIWRSRGIAGDAEIIHQQIGDSARIGITRRKSHGVLKIAADAVWFFGADKRLGNELWRMTP